MILIKYVLSCIFGCDIGDYQRRIYQQYINENTLEILSTIEKHELNVEELERVLVPKTEVKKYLAIINNVIL